MHSPVTCLAVALLSRPVVAADPPPRAVKDVERDIEAATKKLSELRAELLAAQRAEKPKPDLTLLPPTGGHVVLAATGTAYDAYGQDPAGYGQPQHGPNPHQ